jgi:hypothetical protein
MTAETAPGQAGTLPGGPAEPRPARSSLPDRMARYGIWLAVIAHIVLHDRRFQATVIARAIGAYALGSVTKNNRARPLRRATAWYNVQGQVHDAKVLHRGGRALKGQALDPRMTPGGLSHGVETAMLKVLTSRWPSWPGSSAACCPG